MFPVTLQVRDVSLRDGLQSEDPIDTESKFAIFLALVQAGVDDFEITSFVRPDKVPALADAERFSELTSSYPVRRAALALNVRGAERALDAGYIHLQYVISVSERHSVSNAGRTPNDAVRELAHIVDSAGPDRVELTVATAFGCPYEGPVAVSAVLSLIDAAHSLGVRAFTLADTIGTAVPTDVSAMFARVRAKFSDAAFAGHFHDTRGLAIANGLAAVEAGAIRLDASVGGLGGCPFAPGASGNVPTEDLVHALHGMGIETGINLDQLLDAAQLACDAVGKPINSHIGLAGPRFAARSL